MKRTRAFVCRAPLSRLARPKAEQLSLSLLNNEAVTQYQRIAAFFISLTFSLTLDSHSWLEPYLPSWRNAGNGAVSWLFGHIESIC